MTTLSGSFRFKTDFIGDWESDGTVYFAYFDNEKGLYFVAPDVVEGNLYEGTELSIEKVTEYIENKEWLVVK